MLAVADGVSIVTENVFQGGRFRYVDELRRMGADIRTEGHHAVVRAGAGLRGAPVRAHDIRAGAAMVVAGPGGRGRDGGERRPPHRPGLRALRGEAGRPRRRHRAQVGRPGSRRLRGSVPVGSGTGGPVGPAGRPGRSGPASPVCSCLASSRLARRLADQQEPADHDRGASTRQQSRPNHPGGRARGQPHEARSGPEPVATVTWPAGGARTSPTSVADGNSLGRGGVSTWERFRRRARSARMTGAAEEA